MHFGAVYWERHAFEGQVHLTSNSYPNIVLQVPSYKTVRESLRIEWVEITYKMPTRSLYRINNYSFSIPLTFLRS